MGIRDKPSTFGIYGVTKEAPGYTFARLFEGEVANQILTHNQQCVVVAKIHTSVVFAHI
jgi:hypothetical protein